jgi:hypothetical protein
MMETAGTSETSVNFYQTTRRSNPQDNHLRTRRREDLKSYLFSCLHDDTDRSPENGNRMTVEVQEPETIFPTFISSVSTRYGVCVCCNRKFAPNVVNDMNCFRWFSSLVDVVIGLIFLCALHILTSCFVFAVRHGLSLWRENTNCKYIKTKCQVKYSDIRETN